MRPNTPFNMPDFDQHDAEPIEENEVARWTASLRVVLALADRCVDQLRRLSLTNRDALRELADLQYALSQSDRLADALLIAPPDPPSTNLNEFLALEESDLRRQLKPNITLELRLDAVGAYVGVSREDLEMILRILIETARTSLTNDDTLTVRTSLIDQIRSGPAHVPPHIRRYARLSISGTVMASARDLYHRIAYPVPTGDPSGVMESLAARVRRVGGWIFVENLVRAGSRIHLCLPLATDTGS
jgi:signal transduction histidine kinase